MKKKSRPTAPVQTPPPTRELDAQIVVRLSREQLDDLHAALQIHNDLTGRALNRAQFVRDVLAAALHGDARSFPEGLPIRKAS